MKFGLILSLDYEIFGNGKGSVLNHIFEPTSNILKICDENGFKLTIMFEVCEYWAFKAAENRGDLNHLDYSPSGIMEEQIRKALSSGHDVQLHTHPQWLNSKLINNNWILDFNQWKLSDLPYSNESNDGNYSILSVLGEGKKTLENILQNVDKSYKCIAYRAGSWCIQPEEEIIKAMKNVDIRIDSSVFKDGKSSGLSSYNYEQAPYSIGYWWTNSKDVCKIDSSKKKTSWKYLFKL